MKEQIPVDESALAPSVDDGALHELSPDVGYQRIAIVNVAFIRGKGAGNGERWALVDAGLHGSAGAIRRAADRWAGEGSRPEAILLTHGHFDHVGVLLELAEGWDVPIYAHEAEHPYLNGSSSYPPPDPSVGGGLMSTMSRFFPKGPIDVGSRLQALPSDGSVPVLPGWSWIHTPGHTPGHVSLWGEVDRTLVAGDAFITTKQESAYAAATQRPELHGPPMYFTPDWDAARESVRRLAALDPETVVTGHGRALAGAEMREALHQLAHDFDRVAVPDRGTYVTPKSPDRPARG